MMLNSCNLAGKFTFTGNDKHTTYVKESTGAQHTSTCFLVIQIYELQQILRYYYRNYHDAENK